MAVLVTYTFSLDRGISIKLRIGLKVGIASIVGEAPEKWANDNVELANVTPLFFEMFSRRVDLESTTPRDRPQIAERYASRQLISSISADQQKSGSHRPGS